MLFSCKAGEKSIGNWDFCEFWCFFLTERARKASEIEIFANSDAFFLRSGREKHRKLRFLRILMLFSWEAGEESIRNWDFCEFWCFFLEKLGRKASEFKNYAESDAFCFFGRGDQGDRKQRKLRAEEPQGPSPWFPTAIYAQADDEGGKLGVRVQTSNVSDPTFEEAATNIMIDKALETGENGTERDYLLERFSRRWSWTGN